MVVQLNSPPYSHSHCSPQHTEADGEKVTFILKEVDRIPLYLQLCVQLLVSLLTSSKGLEAGAAVRRGRWFVTSPQSTIS